MTQQEDSQDLAVPRSYSLPKSLHDRIAREAKAKSWKKSFVVAEAVRFWLRNYGTEEKVP